MVKTCVPLQLFLLELQLQHHSTELHVKVISPLQFPLIVLTDVQSMPENKKRRIELRSSSTDASGAAGSGTEGRGSIMPGANNWTDFAFTLDQIHEANKPELLSAPVDQFLVKSVETSALGFNLLKVLFHLLSPFSLMRAEFC